MSYTLVLMRHGESEWNLQNRFTGWCDVDLSDKGVAEATEAGSVLKREGLSFDCAYTSLLTRAIRTTNIVLRTMGLAWVPVHKHWELNERHYGDLQGYNKQEMTDKVGAEQVKIWRRSYDTPPPPLAAGSEMDARQDPRYARLGEGVVPLCESLKDTVDRVIPFWERVLKPLVMGGTKIFVGAHGNSLRALIKHLDGISDEDIIELNIPTGKPIRYTIGADGAAARRSYID